MQKDCRRGHGPPPPPGSQNEIGFQVRSLSHMIKRQVDKGVGEGGDDPIRGMQGWILGYLYERQGEDVFQRDIQSQLGVRRSTATGILQLMEKNGLIKRSPVEWDARLKKLELTPKSIEMHENVDRNIREVEKNLSYTLTPEEKETFLRLCEKIKAGLRALPEERKT